MNYYAYPRKPRNNSPSCTTSIHSPRIPQTIILIHMLFSTTEQIDVKGFPRRRHYSCMHRTPRITHHYQPHSNYKALLTCKEHKETHHNRHPSHQQHYTPVTLNRPTNVYIYTANRNKQRSAHKQAKLAVRSSSTAVPTDKADITVLRESTSVYSHGYGWTSHTNINKHRSTHSQTQAHTTKNTTTVALDAATDHITQSTFISHC